jgi:hypothetical protein
MLKSQDFLNRVNQILEEKKEQEEKLIFIKNDFEKKKGELDIQLKKKVDNLANSNKEKINLLKKKFDTKITPLNSKMKDSEKSLTMLLGEIQLAKIKGDITEEQHKELMGKLIF